MMFLMWLFWIIIFALIVGLIARTARSSLGQKAEPPLEILKSRYAKGEITKDEFDRVWKDLAGK